MEQEVQEDQIEDKETGEHEEALFADYLVPFDRCIMRKSTLSYHLHYLFWEQLKQNEYFECQVHRGQFQGRSLSAMIGFMKGMISNSSFYRIMMVLGDDSYEVAISPDEKGILAAWKWLETEFMSAISLLDPEERPNWAIKYFEQRKWRIPADPLAEVLDTKKVSKFIKKREERDEQVTQELNALRRTFTELALDVVHTEIETDEEDPMEKLIKAGEEMLRKLDKGKKLVKEMKELDKNMIEYVLYLTK